MSAAMSSASQAQAQARSAFVSCALIGESVVVHLIDGTICEGLMIGALDTTLALGSLRFKRSPVHPGVALAESFDETLLVPWEQVLMLTSASVPMDLGTDGVPLRPTFGAQQRWADADDGEDDENLEDLEQGHKEGEWDQFEANRKRGVRSSYDEARYTTALDEGKLSREQVKQADRIARDIQRGGAISHQHAIERGEAVVEDEGAEFSDVQRPELAQYHTPQELHAQQAQAQQLPEQPQPPRATPPPRRVSPLPPLAVTARKSPVPGRGRSGSTAGAGARASAAAAATRERAPIRRRRPANSGGALLGAAADAYAAAAADPSARGAGVSHCSPAWPFGETGVVFDDDLDDIDVDDYELLLAKDRDASAPRYQHFVSAADTMPPPLGAVASSVAAASAPVLRSGPPLAHGDDASDQPQQPMRAQTPPPATPPLQPQPAQPPPPLAVSSAVGAASSRSPGSGGVSLARGGKAAPGTALPFSTPPGGAPVVMPTVVVGAHHHHHHHQHQHHHQMPQQPVAQHHHHHHRHSNAPAALHFSQHQHQHQHEHQHQHHHYAHYPASGPNSRTVSTQDFQPTQPTRPPPGTSARSPSMGDSGFVPRASAAEFVPGAGLVSAPSSPPPQPTYPAQARTAGSASFSPHHYHQHHQVQQPQDCGQNFAQQQQQQQHYHHQPQQHDQHQHQHLHHHHQHQYNHHYSPQYGHHHHHHQAHSFSGSPLQPAPAPSPATAPPPASLSRGGASGGMMLRGRK